MKWVQWLSLCKTRGLRHWEMSRFPMVTELLRILLEYALVINPDILPFKHWHTDMTFCELQDELSINSIFQCLLILITVIFHKVMIWKIRFFVFDDRSVSKFKYWTCYISSSYVLLRSKTSSDADFISF